MGVGMGMGAEDVAAQAPVVRPIVTARPGGRHVGWPRDRRLEGTYVFAHARGMMQPFSASARSLLLSSSLAAFCN